MRHAPVRAASRRDNNTQSVPECVCVCVRSTCFSANSGCKISNQLCLLLSLFRSPSLSLSPSFTLDTLHAAGVEVEAWPGCALLSTHTHTLLCNSGLLQLWFQFQFPQLPVAAARPPSGITLRRKHFAKWFMSRAAKHLNMKIFFVYEIGSPSPRCYATASPVLSESILSPPCSSCMNVADTCPFCCPFVGIFSRLCRPFCTPTLSTP